MMPHIADEPLDTLPWEHGDFLEILSHYDGPRVVLQKDALGKLYIGWWNVRTMSASDGSMWASAPPACG